MDEEEPVSNRLIGVRWQPSAWRLHTRISVVLLVPVLVALMLAGTRVQSELDRAGGLSAVRDQMPVLQGIRELTELVDQEIVDQGDTTKAAKVAAKAAAVHHDAEFGRLDPETTRTLNAELEKLGEAPNPSSTPDSVIAGYHDVVLSLAEILPTVVAQAGSSDLDDAANIARALIQLRTGLAVEETLVRKPAETTTLAATQRAAAEKAVLTAQIQRAMRPGAEAVRFATVTAGHPGDPHAENAALGDLLTERIDALADSVGDQTNAARSDALRDTALVMGALLGALTIALLVARSLVGPVRKLHAAALDVSRHRLPDTIERIRAGETVHWQELEPIPVDSEEEIGQLARAFDDMHQQAVRLAIGEQAELRIQVSEMFMTLSRRSQSLVELQLSVIEDLESDEQDPQRLGELFQVDHIATRLRRNGENLQVLAGGRPVRRDAGPLATVELLRAATSEIKDYQRIVLGNAPHGSVQAQAAADVVHILAELLENATRFSPPEERVVLTADRGADGGVLIEVVDTGLGMTREDLETANSRLAAGATVSPETTRRMGLFVVGRLAAPHGVTVRLRPTTTRTAKSGTTASVHVPGELVLLDLPPSSPSDSVTGPLWPNEESENGPMKTAMPTPIFDRMLSHWFTEAPAPAEQHPAMSGRLEDAAQPVTANLWTTPADEARLAAEAAVVPTDDLELTASGLPTRSPGSQLAPGAVSPRQTTPQDKAFRDATAVRNNLSRHYSGMRAARHRTTNEPAVEANAEQR